MNKYSYLLQPYKGSSSRYHCPHCKQKTFCRYVDTETGTHLSPQAGRCNREQKCGYHYTPRQYFTDNGYTQTPHHIVPHTPKRAEPVVQPSYIPPHLLKASLKAYSDNNFVQYLLSLFNSDTVSKLAHTYAIGTSKHWKGACVFWQVDSGGNARTGKVMLYHPATGKRVKQPYSHITWVHSLLKKPDFNLKQCLFGEQLLHGNTKTVALVESEKTAVIASVYLPQLVWLAVGSLSNLTAEKCGVLRGRRVILYPDLNGYDKWKKKAEQLSAIATFGVSDLLERKATDEERNGGLDLADYLVRLAPKANASTLPDLQPEGYDDFDDSVWA